MRHTQRLGRIGAAAGAVSLLILLGAGPAAAEEPVDEPLVEDTTVAHPDPDQPVTDDGLEYTTQVVDEDGEVVDPTAELVLEEDVSITGVDEPASAGRGWLAAAGGLVLLACAGAGGVVAVRRWAAVTE